jgi:uncharacterized delta-60 repeat protein
MNSEGYPSRSSKVQCGFQINCNFPGFRTILNWLMVVVAAMSLTSIVLTPAWAKNGDLDLTFDPGIGVSKIPALWSQSFYTNPPGGTNPLNGYSLIIGSFTTVGGHNSMTIARLKNNGTIDDTFTAEVDGRITNLILLTPGSADSKILICGPFSTTNATGGTYHGLARLNSNGTVDTTFNQTFDNGPEGPGAQAIGVQTDGKIIVGGFSMRLRNDPNNVYYLLRLNGNGTVDPNYPKYSAPGGFVRMVTVFSKTDPFYPNHSRLAVSVPDTSVQGRSVAYMRLFDGNGKVVSSLGDESLNGPIINWNNQNFNQPSQPPKPILVGQFSQVFGQPRNQVARLSADWMSLDDTFSIAGDGSDKFVQRVTVEKVNNLETGKIVLAGNFTSFSGTLCGNLVRLKPDGQGPMIVDDRFNRGGSGADDRIWTLFQTGFGGAAPTYVILGGFQHFNGTANTRACIAHLDINGNLTPIYSSFTAANNSPWAVYATEILKDGKILIGGDFSGYRGKSQYGMAKLNSDGSLDPTFYGGANGIIKAIRVQPDGKILIAGNFPNTSTYVACTSLARLNPDGSSDMTFNPVVSAEWGALGTLNNLELQDDGKIFITGIFQDVNGHSTPYAARLNPDGTPDQTFIARLVDVPGCSDFQVNAGGKMDGLYPLAGSVTYNGNPCGFYARLTDTGALDTSFDPDFPVAHVNLFNGPVLCGTGTDNGRFLVGGDFTQMLDAKNTSVGHIAEFTSDGLLNTAFKANPGTDNSVYAIQDMLQMPKLLLGGDFTSYNGMAWNFLTRVNPSGTPDPSFNPGDGTNGRVYSIREVDKQRCLIAGSFTTYNGVSRNGIARFINFGNPDNSKK